jgi:hypothetical protein
MGKLKLKDIYTLLKLFPFLVSGYERYASGKLSKTAKH